MRLYARRVLGMAVLFAATGPLAFAADAKEEAIQKDRKRFEGTWQVVSLEVDGNKAAEADAQKIRVINEADGAWTIEIEGKVAARGTSKIDPTKKPRTIDLTVTEGNRKGKTTLAIYHFEGDPRRVCYPPPDKKRP